MSIVLITGYPGVGKDTFAQMIVDEYEKKVGSQFSGRKRSLADALKKCCIGLFNLNPNDCFGPSVRRSNLTSVRWTDVEKEFRMKSDSDYMTVREVLQIIGTEALRRVMPNIWVNSIMYGITSEHGKGENLLVIPDCRFANEFGQFDAVFSSVFLLNLTRPGHGSVNSHASESGMGEYLRVAEIFENDGDLEDLRRKASAFVERLL